MNLLIPNLLQQELWQYASSTNNEVCGVLIGKKNSQDTYIVSNIIYDDKPIQQSPFGVARNTKNVYPLVRDIVVHSADPTIDYIGDWHSHPNMSCQFSHTDANAIFGLLADPAYLFVEGIILVIVNSSHCLRGFYFSPNLELPTETIVKSI